MTDALSAAIEQSDDASGASSYGYAWVRWASSSMVALQLGRGLSWARNGQNGVTAAFGQFVTVEVVDGQLTVTRIDFTTPTPDPAPHADGLPYDGDSWHSSEDPDFSPTALNRWHPPAVPVWTLNQTGTGSGRPYPPALETELEYGWEWQDGAWLAKSGWVWYAAQLCQYPLPGWVRIKTLSPDPLPLKIDVAYRQRPPQDDEGLLIAAVASFTCVLEYRDRPYRFMLPQAFQNLVVAGNYGGFRFGVNDSTTRTSRLAVGVDGGMSVEVARPEDLTPDGFAAWNPAGEIRDY